MKKLGMVIINYNDFKTTNRLISNIKDYNVLDKIVIVDNSSTDDSYEKLKSLTSQKIEVIKTTSNKGYASGLNYGAKYLLDMFDDIAIIFSNSDIIIKNEKDLEQLKNDINDDIKVVGPVVEEHNNLNRGGKMATPFIEILSNLPLISRYFKKKLLYYTDNYYNEDKVNVDVVSGCFFLVDGKTLKEIDYFDEFTFLYYEEFILANKFKSYYANENAAIQTQTNLNSLDANSSNSNQSNLGMMNMQEFLSKFAK